MKKITLLQLKTLFFALFITISIGAQVGIGTNAPSGGSILDITSADKGIVIPRINIADLTTIAPVTGGAPVGLLAWNTNGTTGVGYHYWDGNDWIPFTTSSTPRDDWALAGNALTGGEVLGTTSTDDLDIITDGNDRMRVQANGQVTVNFGAGLGNAGQQLNVVGTANDDDAIAGYSTGAGTGVYGQHVTTAGPVNGTGNAVYGLADATATSVGVRGTNFGDGLAMRAENFFSTNFSLHAIDGTTSVYGDNTFGAIGVSGTHFGAGIGVRGENFFGNNFSIYGIDGFYSVYGDNNLGGEGVVGATDSAVSNGIWGLNANAAGTGILGGQNGLYVFPTGGTGVAGSGSTLGVYGYAGEGDDTVANEGNSAGQFTLDTDSDSATGGNNDTRALALISGYDNVSPDGILAARDIYYGGYFQGGNTNNTPSYAYTGLKYNTNTNGGGGTAYKIIGNGSVSTLIKDQNNTPRVLFATEAPEILFEDYGTGKLINGQATINIDPILKNAIYVDEKHPLKVFIQLEGDCNGVYVTNKSANGFTVKELQGGQSNVSFSWHIVANRADDIDNNGNVTSKHVGLRLPIGPGPQLGKKGIRKEVKEPSQISNEKAKSKILPKDVAKRIQEKKGKSRTSVIEDKSINLNEKPQTSSNKKQ